jgi:hypothetical protein
MFGALLRYDTLGFLNNMSTAVSPAKYKQRFKEGYRVELFASFFNRYMPYYFGLFYDLEHPFGCLGNFYTCTLDYGKFAANPPFTISAMNSMFEHLHRNLQKAQIQVYITIPLWYLPDRHKYNNIYTKEKLDTSYTNDLRKDLVADYIVVDKLYPMKKYYFYNYLLGKQIHITQVNVFVVSSIMNKANKHTKNQRYDYYDT